MKERSKTAGKGKKRGGKAKGAEPFFVPLSRLTFEQRILDGEPTSHLREFWDGGGGDVDDWRWREIDKLRDRRKEGVWELQWMSTEMVKSADIEQVL